MNFNRHLPLAALALSLIAASAHANTDMAAAWRQWTEARAEVVDLRKGAEQARIRIDAGAPRRGDPRGWDIAAIRKGGVWRVVWRGYRVTQQTTSTTRWQARDLKPSESAELDRLLADRSLWNAPAYADAAVIDANGRTRRCVGGPRTDFDVQVGARRWGGTHLCVVDGPPGALRQAVMRAALGPGDYGRPGTRLKR